MDERPESRKLPTKLKNLGAPNWLHATLEVSAGEIDAAVKAIVGEEAFDYLRSVNSGHPGSITSVHATSAELAFEQLVLLVKQSAAGRGLSRADIKELLYLLIDVVIQFDTQQRQRCIKEIWYEPARKHRGTAGAF